MPKGGSGLTPTQYPGGWYHTPTPHASPINLQDRKADGSQEMWKYSSKEESSLLTSAGVQREGRRPRCWVTQVFPTTAEVDTVLLVVQMRTPRCRGDM